MVGKWIGAVRYLSVCSGIGGRPAKDMLGLTFGRLRVTERVPVSNRGRKDQARWRCVCECGGEIVVTGTALRTGRNKSCGCFRRDRMGAMFRSHGKSQTPEYCMFYDARKRALAQDVPFTIAPDDIRIPTHCPVLGIELMQTGPRDNRPSLDKILVERGYTPNNVRVISFRANRIKSDASTNEIRAVLKYMEDAECVI